MTTMMMRYDILRLRSTVYLVYFFLSHQGIAPCQRAMSKHGRGEQ